MNILTYEFPSNESGMDEVLLRTCHPPSPLYNHLQRVPAYVICRSSRSIRHQAFSQCRGVRILTTAKEKERTLT